MVEVEEMEETEELEGCVVEGDAMSLVQSAQDVGCRKEA